MHHADLQHARSNIVQMQDASCKMPHALMHAHARTGARAHAHVQAHTDQAMEHAALRSWPAGCASCLAASSSGSPNRRSSPPVPRDPDWLGLAWIGVAWRDVAWSDRRTAGRLRAVHSECTSTASLCVASRCIALPLSAQPLCRRTTAMRIVLHCIALHCIALHCIALAALLAVRPSAASAPQRTAHSHAKRSGTQTTCAAGPVPSHHVHHLVARKAATTQPTVGAVASAPSTAAHGMRQRWNSS